MSTDPADRVLCFDEKGQIVPVARAELSYAPAVYGILIEEGRALLLTLPLIPSEFNETEENAPRWRLIGGRIRPGDVPADGLARFFRRSTGFAPLLQQLVRVETRYVIEKGRPWALGGLFYRVTRPGGAVVTPQQDEHRPVWVPIQELTRASVPFGFSAIVSQQKREENS